MTTIELEIKVIKRFVVKDKRDRYLNFLSNNKTRGKFAFQLAHFNDWDYRLFEELKGNVSKTVTDIKDKIKVLPKIADCYLISEDIELDRKRLAIDEALLEAIGRGIGTIVVFGDAEIIFYEGEGPKDSWISKRVTT